MPLQPTRRPPPTAIGLATLALAVTLALTACGGGGGADTPAGPATPAKDADDGTAASGAPAPTSPPGTGQTVAQPTNTDGRLLASNCFQCHGTGGLGGFDSIRGADAGEVLDYMTQTAASDIMAAHAQGYTPEQLRKIIAYLQR